ncbi:hypothetical protein [Dyella sp. ASV21]|uniref:hypothetical protein n=1 Tax=Dyella sp. ASV21 TaxID=2795114 RepID=UPI0018EBBD4A|nr:hypothetical protein [Dyella sp. ASV21]
MWRKRERGGLRWTAVLLGVVFAGAVLAQDEAKPNEQVTGTGGRFLHYSSKQVNVDLTEQDQETLQRVRDHRYAAGLEPALDAVLTTLRDQGYVATSIDRDFHLIEARHDEVLVSKGRETLRGLLKSKMALPGKPDHQTTEALVLLMPATDGQGVLARTRFRRTIWDSNGDSRTSVVSEAETYEQFYAALAAHLSR